MDKLETMRAFTVVVQENSFSRAAEKLALSPQLVSKYVSALEEQLKTRLLNRTTRRVSVTEAGQHYFDRCQQILADIEETEGSLSDMSRTISGNLSISAPMSFGVHHLPPLLNAFRQSFPDVMLDVDLTDQKIDIVDEGVDIALRIGRLPSSSMIARKLTDIRICICASPDYLQRHGEPDTPAGLQGHRYLKYSYSDGSKPMAGIRSLPDRFQLQPHMCSNNGNILVEAAIAGEGFAIQPTFIAGEAIADGRLKCILTAYEPPQLGLYAIYANRRFLPAKVREFIDFADAFYEKLPYWDQAIAD